MIKARPLAFESLPSVLNPSEGWIVTANQAVIGPPYPFFLTDDWAYGARSQRIVDLIEESTAGGAKVNAERMRQIQMDGHNELAAFLAPRLVDLPTTELTAPAVALLDGWDAQQTADSAPAAWIGRPVLLVSLVDPLKKHERRTQADSWQPPAGQHPSGIPGTSQVVVADSCGTRVVIVNSAAHWIPTRATTSA